MDASGKYVCLTTEQMAVLERLYHECPNPSSIRLQQLIQKAAAEEEEEATTVLANIEPKQIQLWFRNRRCREKKQKKLESARLVSTNAKLAAFNRLLMEENERLTRHTSQLARDNLMLRQQLHDLPPGHGTGYHLGPRQSLKNQDVRHGMKEGAANGGSLLNALGGHENTPQGSSSLQIPVKNGVENSPRGSVSLQIPVQNGVASTDASCDSVITVGLPQNSTPRHSPPEVNSMGLLAVVDETLTEFLSKAKKIAREWIQLSSSMKETGGNGVVARELCSGDQYVEDQESQS